MAHTVTTQVLEEGRKFTVIKVSIKGDSKDATELSDQVIFDASAYNDYGSKTNNKLYDIDYCLNGFTGELNWDATANVPLMVLAKDSPYRDCFIKVEGGLKNNAGTGKTGDILLTTSGLASTTNAGHIILRVAWRE